jgi:hypothetical protein
VVGGEEWWAEKSGGGEGREVEWRGGKEAEKRGERGGGRGRGGDMEVEVEVEEAFRIFF